MNNQMIKKSDLSIFDKIKTFLKNMFYKNKNEIIVPKNMNTSKIQEKKENGFETNLKVEISEEQEKEMKLKKFIDEIENHPDIIENLSNERLDKLISYYEKVTSEKQRKIEKLKASFNLNIYE